MNCEHCQGKGFIWEWDLNLRCFAHAPCLHCCEDEHADEVSRMTAEGCPNDGGE